MKHLSFERNTLVHPSATVFHPVSLCKEDHYIHTTQYHVPEWLPPSSVVISITYRSTFEHTQHLDYSSSRPWCYRKLLRSFSVPHSIMVILFSMIVLLCINTNQRWKCHNQPLIISSSASLPPLLTTDIYRMLKTTKNKLQIPTHDHSCSSANRALCGLQISCVLPTCVNCRTTHGSVNRDGR